MSVLQFLSTTGALFFFHTKFYFVVGLLTYLVTETRVRQAARPWCLSLLLGLLVLEVFLVHGDGDVFASWLPYTTVHEKVCCMYCGGK